MNVPFILLEIEVSIDTSHYLIISFFFLAELAASVPRTEIVGKGDYFRFGMRDSLAIEASFLQVRRFLFLAFGFLAFLLLFIVL